MPFFAVPSSPPDNVIALSSSSTTITVSWDIVPPIDQNGIITMYEVFYQPLETFGGVIGTLTRNVSAPDMSVVLTNLQEFVNYNISVRAYTSVGEGLYSGDFTVQTQEGSKLIIFLCYCQKKAYHLYPSPFHAVPARPPDNVTALANSSTTIIVNWDIVPPIDQNGIITIYEVLYQPLETSWTGGVLSVNVTGFSVSITIIEGFLNYIISVRAYTNVGEGHNSDSVLIDGKLQILLELFDCLTNRLSPASSPSFFGVSSDYWRPVQCNMQDNT